jgi:hypothetical protein
MAHDLKPYENITRVFWIKIELKGDQEAGEQALGDIKDVMSGEKQLIYQLPDIIDFMIPYLESMGIRLPRFWWLGILAKRKRRKNNPGHSKPISEDGEYRTNP